MDQVARAGMTGADPCAVAGDAPDGSGRSAPSVRELLTAAALPGDSPRLDAELLLAHALGRSRTWLFAHDDAVPTPTQQQAVERLFQRRRAGEPVAYLLGEREFWSLPLRVTADTLIPRPETERLVELALERLPPDRPTDLLDLGTGSGAIALAIARERPLARIVAIDASAAALTVARDNAARLAPGRIDFRLGDWFAPVAGERFELIIANPPYIADSDPHLDRGDPRFEPRSALAAGPEGLDAIVAILDRAGARLRPGGWLLIEHGHEQGEAVRGLFVAAALVEVATARDLERRERVTLGRRPNP